LGGARSPGGAPDGRGSRILGDITRALGMQRLYAHQAAAMAAVDAGRSVLVCTPPGSGRQVLLDAMALRAVLEDGDRVLVLGAGPGAVSAASARFDERAEATHWKWNILAMNLAGRAGAADPSQSQPALVFADADAASR